MVQVSLRHILSQAATQILRLASALLPQSRGIVSDYRYIDQPIYQPNLRFLFIATIGMWRLIGGSGSIEGSRAAGNDNDGVAGVHEDEFSSAAALQAGRDDDVGKPLLSQISFPLP